MKTTIRNLGFAVFCLTLLTQCREESRFYSNVQRSDVFYQLYDEAKYDFLWVMDNSPSMLPRREFVRDNMQSFLNILNSRKAIDYQMAMTDVDMFTTAGALIGTNGGLKVVKSTSSNPVADFAGIVNNVVDTDYSFWEQSLESMYQALYLSKSQFIRHGVPTIVVIVTDADDFSCQSNCSGVQPEDNPDWVPYPVSRYVDYLTSVSAANDSDMNVFPITVTADDNCSLDAIGDRVVQVQQAIGNSGKTGSLCPSKLAASFFGIAQTIADRGAVFKLSSQASGTGINVFINDELIPNAPENYEYEASTNSIVFTGVVPKKGQYIQVTYNEKVD